MYPTQHEIVAKILRALDQASKESDEYKDVCANTYAQFVPIFTDDDLIGFCTDEIGGAYSFMEITNEQRAWWKARPKSLGGN